MKLESQFFNKFFFSFLISIILCTLVVIAILITFTFDKYDKRTTEKIINLERNYSKLIIGSVNIIITNKFLSLQTGLNELILLYQKKAREILISEKEEELNDEYLKCLLTFDAYSCDDEETDTSALAFWISDGYTTEEDLDEHQDIKQQLIAYSHIIKNINALYELAKPDVFDYFFYFEKNELYISYPILDGCGTYFVYFMTYEYLDIEGCNQDNGDPYEAFRFKCLTFYKNIKKSKTSIFDKNYLSQNKTIFISNFYAIDDYTYKLDNKELTLCSQFDDPITEGKGYLCVNRIYKGIIDSLEEINSQVAGYFFLSNIGFSNTLYFPKEGYNPKSSSEQIYGWDIDYLLSEKAFFRDNVEKIITSNYIDFVGENIYDEIYVNGKNPNDQRFYINGKEFRYAIYPIILINLNGIKEHVMSLIYIYNHQLYLDKLDNYYNEKIIMIIIEVLIFIMFGFGLLYLINLTFNNLVKYIVIPIKNVNYMLKGINIGGKNRLKYLEFLIQKRDETLEQLNNVFINENQKMQNRKSNEINFDSINKNKKEEDYIDKDKLINKEKKSKNDSKNEIKKKVSEIDKTFDEINNYLEEELNFYDCDEQLLQYRPLEIQYLVKSLMELKDVMAFTSKDREEKNIINYAYSEQVFRNFQIKEGAIICHSNMGNLQSQLLKYDKAIYHLALSLQDNQIQKFINQNLNDELDENDSLLNRISHSFNKEEKALKNNVLLEKQISSSKYKFSKKKIGNLINVRYCRLIHAYYNFFKNLKKLKVINNENITELYVNDQFHTINYYHKVIIQFIYLSYFKNDLIKIGESIIDYIEFLIKFKFKVSSEEKYFLNIDQRDNPTFKEKQEIKKKIFDKIISWFNLFDEYISFVKSNSSLGDSKSIINDYSNSINTDNFEFNLESQTTFMFKINIQKCNFLKGKFSLYCKNYNDSLFYFTNAAKNNSIVIDGLIKKRSLKHIYKLLIKMIKKFEKLGIINLYMNKELKRNKKDKILSNKKYKIARKSSFKEAPLTFGQEFQKITEDIIKDISEFTIKQEKDIMILIDFNIYNEKDDNLTYKRNMFDIYIEEALKVLNNYLSSNDRFGVMIYMNDFKIICPLIYVSQIDAENFSKDLYRYKNDILNENIDDIENFDIDFMDFIDNNEYNFDENNNNSYSLEENSYDTNSLENNYEKINGFVKTINYIEGYLAKKEGSKNQKYIIIFTDIINIQIIEGKQIDTYFEDLRGDKHMILFLVGKNINTHRKKDNNNIEELILNQFGEKSEIIKFDNIKRIKEILSNNKDIKEEIFYPNETYK